RVPQAVLAAEFAVEELAEGRRLVLEISVEHGVSVEEQPGSQALGNLPIIREVEVVDLGNVPGFLSGTVEIVDQRLDEFATAHDPSIVGSRQQMKSALQNSMHDHGGSVQSAGHRQGHQKQ